MIPIGKLEDLIRGRLRKMSKGKEEKVITIPIQEYIKLQKKASLLYALEKYGIKACEFYKDAKKLANSHFFDEEDKGNG